MRNESGSDSMAAFTSSSVKLARASSSALRLIVPSLRREAAVQVQVLDVFDVGDLGPPLGRPVRVDVGVGQDPVQPRPKVGALGEAAEAPVGTQIGLLDQVLGVGRVAGHPERGAVQRRHVLHGELGEPGLVGHDQRR